MENELNNTVSEVAGNVSTAAAEIVSSSANAFALPGWAWTGIGSVATLIGGALIYFGVRLGKRIFKKRHYVDVKPKTEAEPVKAENVEVVDEDKKTEKNTDK